MADNRVKQIIEIITRGAKKSEKEVKGVSKGLNGLAASAAKAAGAYFGARALLSGIKSSIDLFAKQELAEKKLEAALGRTSLKLLNQAKALQQVSMFGDEVIIEAQMMIGSFIKEEDAIASATKATMDLAAAKGFDLVAAADLVSKTLGSSTNALTRYGIEVKGAVGSTERLTSLTDNIAKVFGGQATEQAKTLAGSLAQMKNAMGDAGEEIGNFLSPAIEKSAGFFKTAAENVGSFFRSLTETELDTTIRLLEELNVESESLIKLKNLQIDRDIKILNQELKESNTLGLSAEQIEARLDAIQKERIKNTEELAVIMGTTTEEERENLKLKERDLDLSMMGLQHSNDAELVASRVNQVNAQKLELQTQSGEFQKTTLENLTKEEEHLLDLFAQNASINALQMQKIKIEDTLQKKKDANNNKNIKKEKILAKLRKEESRDVALAEISGAMASAKANLINQIMKSIPFPLNLLLAKGASDKVDDLFSKINVKTAQYGADFVTSGPQMMMVGEGSGPERVQVTPLVDENREGPQGQGITLNISGNVLHDSFIEDDIIPAVREATRMGENLGV